jgi:hypothetical protein
MWSVKTTPKIEKKLPVDWKKEKKEKKERKERK